MDLNWNLDLNWNMDINRNIDRNWNLNVIQNPTLGINENMYLIEDFDLDSKLAVI